MPVTSKSRSSEKSGLSMSIVTQTTVATKRPGTKGKPVDVKQVGRELGVRYVLEGSVRKGGNRVRITTQLIDTSTGQMVAIKAVAHFSIPVSDVARSARFY